MPGGLELAPQILGLILYKTENMCLFLNTGKDDNLHKSDEYSKKYKPLTSYEVNLKNF